MHPTILDAIIPESGHLKGEMQHLLVADVVLIGQQEMWYEIFYDRHRCHPEVMHFKLVIIGDGHGRVPTKVHVHVGPIVFHVVLDEDGTATWKVPANTILDPKSKRVLRPIMLSL